MLARALASVLLCAGVSHAQPPITYVPATDDSWSARVTSQEFLIGAGLFVAGYGGAILYGTQTSDDFGEAQFGAALYVPVIGPWIELFSEPNCGIPGNNLVCQYDTAENLALAATGAAQIAGIGLMTYALLRRREPPPPVTVTPMWAGASGINLSGRF